MSVETRNTSFIELTSIVYSIWSNVRQDSTSLPCTTDDVHLH
jgi:hypothetical protein